MKEEKVGCLAHALLLSLMLVLVSLSNGQEQMAQIDWHDFVVVETIEPSTETLD